MVEAILGWLKLLRGVMCFRFFCRFRFSYFFGGGGGEANIFQKLKIFPVT